MKNLSADSEKTLKSFLLRSRVGGRLEALIEPLPAFSDEDLQVVHRKTEKGLWKDELWTKRDFEALELQLAPVSSQLWEHDPGEPWLRRPSTISRRAQKGNFGPDEHLGPFFWMVGRTYKGPGGQHGDE